MTVCGRSLPGLALLRPDVCLVELRLRLIELVNKRSLLEFESRFRLGSRILAQPLSLHQRRVA